MNIALHGTGRMNHALEELLQNTKHQIVARFNRRHPITLEALAECQVIIDFSHPDAIPNLVDVALMAKVPVVSGTTGWNDQLKKIKQQVESRAGSFLYAANFSIGVAIFRKLVIEAAKRFSPFAEYDFAIHEIHHTGKQDSPSGTARLLGEDLLQHLPGKSRLLLGNSTGKIQPDQLQITSGRLGTIFGLHQVWIDHPDETIQLIHKAKSRMVFARGALQAAQWLPGRTGFFTFDDFLNDFINQAERRGHGK